MSIIKPLRAWEQVKKIKTSEARQVIPQACYQRSLLRVLLWLVFDAMFFIVGMVLVFASSHAGIQLLGGLVSGIATATLFVWAHDVAHGAAFKSAKVAEFIGTVAMLPSLNMYRMWSYGHNKVHHGFTSFTPIDLIWSPLSPKEYQGLSRYHRMIYRIERNFFSCAFHYFRQVWWISMLKFNPGKNEQQRTHYRNGKLLVLAYAVIGSVAAYFFAGGIIGVIAAVVVPFVVFNYFIALIVYLHHTHPEVPFFEQKKEWSHSVGALYCSTIVHCSKLSRILLHNIMVHIPHHLDICIPFYHLPQAYLALKEEYGAYFHEYKFTWGYVRNIFKQCKLYDYESKSWLTFKEARKS